MTSVIAARNAGSSTVRLVLCMNTSPPCGCLKWSARTAETCPDSPTPACCWSSCLVPTTFPMRNATATNANQPKIAVFLWLALQRPMRAAKPFVSLSADICRTPFDDRLRSSRPAEVPISLEPGVRSPWGSTTRRTSGGHPRPSPSFGLVPPLRDESHGAVGALDDPSQLDPRRHAELAERVADVRFDRLGAQEERRADLRIRLAVDDQPRDF